MKTLNEQKAKEICDCDSCKACSRFAEEGAACVFTSTCDRFNGLMQAMEWKEKQFVDKCKEFCNRQTTGEYYNRREVFQIDKYIDDMLNFIKG